jgi:transcription initiation factor TFIIIB Brf1 subunit/transcription initiation factor TFIIB
LGLMKLGRCGEALVQEFIVQQPKLRHRKSMAAGERCRVGRVINEGGPHWLLSAEGGSS